MSDRFPQSELDDLGYLISHNTSPSWQMDNYHFHEFFELNLSLSDDVSWFVADRVYQVKRGTLMIFSDGDLHRSVSPADIPYERYVLYLSPKHLAELSTPQTDLSSCFTRCQMTKTHCLHLDDEQLSALLRLVRRAEGSSRGGLFGQDLRRQIALQEILLFLHQAFETAVVARPVRMEGEVQRVLPVIAHIHRHLQADLSLDRLSELFYLNKYYLGRLFKRATGFTLNEYIIHARILQARSLLRQDVSVQLAGQKVGFNNPSHFIRTFKQLVGSTPKQYQLAVRGRGTQH